MNLPHINQKKNSNTHRSKTDPFYLSKEWKVKRKEILKRDNYLCQECLRNKNITPGDTVDHIIPRSMGGKDLDNNNLETLCRKHHAIKSAKERRR